LILKEDVATSRRSFFQKSSAPTNRGREDMIDHHFRRKLRKEEQRGFGEDDENILFEGLLLQVLVGCILFQRRHLRVLDEKRILRRCSCFCFFLFFKRF
jgi:hypothetical protein